MSRPWGVGDMGESEVSRHRDALGPRHRRPGGRGRAAELSVGSLFVGSLEPVDLSAAKGERERRLLLASLHPELKAAVADAPSSYIWGAVSGDGAAWTKGGEPLAYVPSGGGMGKMVTTPTGDKAMAFTPAFEDNLTNASPAELEAARIRVENAGAAIAMFGGADDQLWPSCKFAQVAMDRLVASGHKATHPDEVTCFEGAGHLINAVALPTTWSTFFPDPLGGTNLALGGTPAGAAHAGRARQGKVRDFFARTLKQ